MKEYRLIIDKILDDIYVLKHYKCLTEIKLQLEAYDLLILKKKQEIEMIYKDVRLKR